jgi:hypothetical protein
MTNRTLALGLLALLLCGTASAAQDRCSPPELQLSCTVRYKMRDGSTVSGESATDNFSDWAEYFDPPACGASLSLNSTEGTFRVAVSENHTMEMQFASAGKSASSRELVNDEPISGTKEVDVPAPGNAKVASVAILCTFGDVAQPE